jgi:hypothetical protein
MWTFQNVKKHEPPTHVFTLGHNQNTSLHGHMVVTKGMVQIKIA